MPIMRACEVGRSRHRLVRHLRTPALTIVDFLSALRDRGRQPADPRPRLTGPDGQSVELPESMFQVLLQVAKAMKAGLAVTVARTT